MTIPDLPEYTEASLRMLLQLLNAGGRALRGEYCGRKQSGPLKGGKTARWEGGRNLFARNSSTLVAAFCINSMSDLKSSRLRKQKIEFVSLDALIPYA